MIRSAKFCPVLIALLLFSMTCGTSTALAQVDLSGSDRTELIYFIGQITSVSGRTASVNLGQCHSLDPIHPVTKEIQQLAIFRPEGSTITPIGIVSVIQSGSISSRVKTDFRTKIQPLDIAVFVRQIGELMNPQEHEDYVLRSAQMRKRQVTNRNSIERNATSKLLSLYGRAYPKWERSRSRVAGFFFARPDLEMSPDLQKLLEQIDLFRKYHADGFQSVKAAGPAWEITMGPLYGQANKIKHQSATAVGVDPEDASAPTLDVVKLRKIVNDRFFDSTSQEKATAAFLTATALRVQPRSLDQWLQTQFPRTQFPEWSDNGATIERIRDSVQKIEANN